MSKVFEIAFTRILAQTVFRVLLQHSMRRLVPSPAHILHAKHGDNFSKLHLYLQANITSSTCNCSWGSLQNKDITTSTGHQQTHAPHVSYVINFRSGHFICRFTQTKPRIAALTTALWQLAMGNNIRSWKPTTNLKDSLQYWMIYNGSVSSSKHRPEVPCRSASEETTNSWCTLGKSGDEIFVNLNKQ